MRKGHSITGLQVIAQDSGKDMGKVLDLIFDHDANQCLALVLRENGLLHSAQVIRYQNIVSIGKDAVIVNSQEAVINPLDDPGLRIVQERSTHLSGTKIITENGLDLGTFADAYLDEPTGKVVGYEISSGFISDTMSGKRYIPAAKTTELRVGEHVLIVPRDLLNDVQQQALEEPTGLKASLHSASEKITQAYEVAKDKVSSTYSNLAEASIEKQKELVIGSIAGKDVYLPAPTMLATDVIIEDHAPLMALDEAVHEMEHGPILVHTGEVITAEHADHAEGAGILHQLILVAGVHSISNTIHSANENLSEGQEHTQQPIQDTEQPMEERVIGLRAGKEIFAPNGSTIVAAGMIITHEVMQTARLYGKESEVIASTEVPASSSEMQNSSVMSSGKPPHIWEAIRDKAAEISGVVSSKKEDYDAANEQKRINNVLGRPVTHVILAKDDSVILNTGEIITHKAVELSRKNDMLEVLLDAANMEEPDLTPESLRTSQRGEAALAEQTK